MTDSQSPTVCLKTKNERTERGICTCRCSVGVEADAPALKGLGIAFEGVEVLLHQPSKRARKKG